MDHVSKVVWYDSFADLSIPMEMLPEKIRSAFNSDHSTMMFIIFETTTSADETMAAIEDIRDLAGKQCFLSGMSAIVTDTKNLAESEVVIYVVIACLLYTSQHDKTGKEDCKITDSDFYYQSCAVDSCNNRLHQYQGEL